MVSDEVPSSLHVHLAIKSFLTAWDRSDFDPAVKVINVIRSFAVV